MRDRRLVIVGLVSALLSEVPAHAHHSFAAEFDGDQPVVLTGTVTKVEWRNPHIWVYLDVKGDDGTVTAWQCEGGAPNNLTRQGWTRESLPVGQAIIVEGWRAKNGTNTCNAGAWKLPNGERLLAPPPV
jgi:hypothetical protein